ncbi:MULTISPECIES: helix-turn-helix domain-containing protein [Cytobacillus]|uniref:helix-turn-helix domain-containing protein n=1 Tax=Cytobacillus TaxID=2675230 RepID=UPI002041F92E|nr:MULTISPECIES: helix-turn-helix transcriptional regulator [Cytobacillus]MCM3394838.1 helix-turn-helix domain-containing protein [Cytobacillus oceanisediminis]UQX56084.1 helix-turn-helix domain-containing protein [Cytobacillus pseudoceanisediminis]
MKISKLRRMRVLNGMTQEHLSLLLGVSQSYLSLLERGQKEITPEINHKIRDIFKNID